VNVNPDTVTKNFVYCFNSILIPLSVVKSTLWPPKSLTWSWSMLLHSSSSYCNDWWIISTPFQLILCLDQVQSCKRVY